MPMIMWSAYFAFLWMASGIVWSVELWSGVCVMSGITGFALALLVLPPPVPTLAPAPQASLS